MKPIIDDRWIMNYISRRSEVAKGDDIQERLNGFAVKIMELCDELPKTFAGRHIGEQLFRCETATAANYAEVRGAESPNDFIHKLGIDRKELNESMVWLNLLEKRRLLPDAKVRVALSECDELCRIVSASRKTAEANQRQKALRRANSEF